MNGYHFRLAYGLVGSSNGMVGLGAFPTYVTYAGTAPWGSLQRGTLRENGTAGACVRGRRTIPTVRGSPNYPRGHLPEASRVTGAPGSEAGHTLDGKAQCATEPAAA